MWGSPCAMAPPTVETLRTRILDSVSRVCAPMGACLRTSSDCSSSASVVIAPMVKPSDPTVMVAYLLSIFLKLTSLVGRNTPAFIINMSAVPPAIGRTAPSSGSSSLIAAAIELGSASSNGVIGSVLQSREARLPIRMQSLQRRDAELLGGRSNRGALFVDGRFEFGGTAEIRHFAGQVEAIDNDGVLHGNLDVAGDALAQRDRHALRTEQPNQAIKRKLGIAGLLHRRKTRMGRSPCGVGHGEELDTAGFKL